jgi:hypothetical protein
VNGRKAGPDEAVGAGELLHERYVLLRKGKRHYALLVRDGW